MRNYTTREIAEILGVDTWRIQRLFESRRLSEPGRFAGKRAIPSVRIPEIVDALRERGWLAGKEGRDGSKTTPQRHGGFHRRLGDAR